MENITVEGCTIELSVKIEKYTYDLIVGTYDVTVTLTGEGSEELMAETTDGIVKIVEKPEEEETEETEET